MRKPYSKVGAIESKRRIIAQNRNERYLNRNDQQSDDDDKQGFPPRETKPCEGIGRKGGNENRNNGSRYGHRNRIPEGTRHAAALLRLRRTVRHRDGIGFSAKHRLIVLRRKMRNDRPLFFLNVQEPSASILPNDSFS